MNVDLESSMTSHNNDDDNKDDLQEYNVEENDEAEEEADDEDFVDEDEDMMCENEDDQSEYTYSDDDDDVGGFMIDTAKTLDIDKRIRSVKNSVPRIELGRKSSKGDISVLDNLLSQCNALFPEAINVEDESFIRLITQKPNQQRSPQKQHHMGAAAAGEPVHKLAKTAGKIAGGLRGRSSPKTKTTTTTPSSSSSAGTSTLIAGVGYEVGSYDQSSSSKLKENLSKAAERQEELDQKCSHLMTRICTFFGHFNGDDGIVLLALKMSRGFNRMLFSLLKNESILDWGRRREVSLQLLALLGRLCQSRFLSSFLLHDLLDGDGTSLTASTSSCDVLLASLYRQADVMKKNQMTVLNGLNQAKKGQKCSPEELLSRDTIEICDLIDSTYSKVLQAIDDGRREGTISEEPKNNKNNNNNDKNNNNEQQLDESSETQGERGRMGKLEEMKLYCDEMRKYKVRYVDLLDAVNNKQARHTFLSNDTTKKGGKESITTVQPRRMIRIASEVAGLSTDLPVEWGSGIFVLIDEDRPDVMKACIMAPDNSPYENGVFEFDISLPASYPNQPPEVKIVTTAGGTVRFNPNLYACGKVCLSLLGTWSGPGWIPETSTLLQVLVSIQSLIFVPDPYFNEPGYDAKSSTNQEQSKQYDKQIRAATLKYAILGAIKTPPPLFEDCIRDHFRFKKRRLLEQLDEWEELAKNQNEGGKKKKKEEEGDSSSSRLVASGGIKSSPTIVADLCKELRKLLNAKSFGQRPTTTTTTTMETTTTTTDVKKK